MKRAIFSARLIPAALLERVEALAQAEARTTSDIITEALEDYIEKRRASPAARKLSAQEAAAKLRELRKGTRLPAGMTLRELIDHGRA